MNFHNKNKRWKSLSVEGRSLKFIVTTHNWNAVFYWTTAYHVPCLKTVKRLVFTCVGVVIRSADGYDLMKIKLSEAEAEYQFRLWRLRSSENFVVGVGSRSGSINQSQCSIPSIVICWFFRFCFRLPQSGFHWIISDGVVSGVGRKWERSDSSYTHSVELVWFISVVGYNKIPRDFPSTQNKTKLTISLGTSHLNAYWVVSRLPTVKKFK